MFKSRVRQIEYANSEYPDSPDPPPSADVKNISMVHQPLLSRSYFTFEEYNISKYPSL